MNCTFPGPHGNASTAPPRRRCRPDTAPLATARQASGSDSMASVMSQADTTSAGLLATCGKVQGMHADDDGSGLHPLSTRSAKRAAGCCPRTIQRPCRTLAPAACSAAHLSAERFHTVTS